VQNRSEGKLPSLFEPSTEVIRKGKAGKPNEFGKMVKLQEAENQIIIDYPKTPPISPIFTADSVTLVVSREKDGKSRLVYAGWDDVRVVQPDGCGQARRGVEGRILPPVRAARYA
jgi:hypothetical protein